MSITLRDVAARAQVSISTASRALNGRSDVSTEARERVMSAAQVLQYTANQNARALKGATSKILGVVLYDARATTFNAALMRGVYDAATPRGYSVIVCDGGASIEAEQEAYRLLLEQRVDGVLVNSGAGGAAPLRRLAAADMPFIVLNRRIDDAGIDVDYVMIDAERGAYLATRHLLELGHARILYHAITPQNVPSLERLPGYRRALAEFDVPYTSELIMETGSSLKDTYARLSSTMQGSKPRPTGIVAYNDTHAVAVLKALHDLGLRVPDDVAVVGQNNLDYTDFLIPPLTSVAHAVQQMGRQGTEILLQKLAWSDELPWLPHRVALEPVLIVRASSGQSLARTPKRPARRTAERSPRLSA